MNNQIKIFLTVYAVLAVMTMAAPAWAEVIGDWEGTPDGWISWEDGQISIDDPSIMPSKYDYAETGATSGSQSIKLTSQGYHQTLSIQLTEAQRTAFMQNTTFSIDMSVTADTLGVGGYARIQEITVNADGIGWTTTDLGDTANFYFWSTSPARTQTFVFDYSTLKESITPTPGFVELILTTNGQRDTTPDPSPFELYFDNAQLTGAAIPYSDLVMEDNPVLYLRFEETPMADSSVNAYWVGPRAGASLVSFGGIGNAVHLDGSQNGCVAASVLASPSWGGVYGDEYSFAPDDITFEFWARIEAMNQYGMIFQQIGPYTREDFAPGMGNSGPAENTLGTLRILNGTVDANDMDFWYPPDSNAPSDEGWHHYVVTYDEQYSGDPNLMQIQFYLDGSLKGSTVVGGNGQPAKLGPELDHLVIGGENNRGYVYNTMTGMIDEFAIYAGVLPSDRVAAHYAQGSVQIEPQNCAEVFIRQQGLNADFDQDCDVDLTDFANVAATWMLCNDPALFGTDPDCGPTW